MMEVSHEGMGGGDIVLGMCGNSCIDGRNRWNVAGEGRDKVNCGRSCYVVGEDLELGGGKDLKVR